MGVPIFPKLETVIHGLIFVKNDFYPATIKNDNGVIAMVFLCNVNVTKNSINF